MNGSVFLDAFAECLVGVAIAHRRPSMRSAMRTLAVMQVSGRHGREHANDTGRMFDRLWNDLQNGARQ